MKLTVRSTDVDKSELLSQCLQRREGQLLENDSVNGSIYLDLKLRRLREPIKLMMAKSYLKRTIRQRYSLKDGVSKEFQHHYCQ